MTMRVRSRQLNKRAFNRRAGAVIDRLDRRVPNETNFGWLYDCMIF